MTGFIKRPFLIFIAVIAVIVTTSFVAYKVSADLLNKGSWTKVERNQALAVTFSGFANSFNNIPNDIKTVELSAKVEKDTELLISLLNEEVKDSVEAKAVIDEVSASIKSYGSSVQRYFEITSYRLEVIKRRI